MDLLVVVMKKSAEDPETKIIEFVFTKFPPTSPLRTVFADYYASQLDDDSEEFNASLPKDFFVAMYTRARAKSRMSPWQNPCKFHEQIGPEVTVHVGAVVVEDEHGDGLFVKMETDP